MSNDTKPSTYAVDARDDVPGRARVTDNDELLSFYKHFYIHHPLLLQDILL